MTGPPMRLFDVMSHLRNTQQLTEGALMPIGVDVRLKCLSLPIVYVLGLLAG